MLSAAGDPSQVDDKFAVVVAGFIGLGGSNKGLSVSGLHHKGSENEVSLLLAAVTLDKESTALDDTVQVHLLTVPIIHAETVELALNCIDM